MSQVLKSPSLVLGLCLLSIWGQLLWLATYFSNNSFQLSFFIVIGFILVALLFSLLLRYHFFSASLKVAQQQTPSWLTSMAQSLSRQLAIPEPKLYTLATKGLNAFAANDLTRRGHIVLHHQVLVSLTQDEVESILAHELCHIEKGHAGTFTFMQGVMLSVTLPLALTFSLVKCLFTGFSQFRENVLTANSFLSLVCFPATSVMLFIASRYWEYKADACAASLVGKQQYMQALRCLHGSFFQHPNLLGMVQRSTGDSAAGVQSTPNNQDGGLTHPSLTQRINALQEIGS